MTVPPPLPWAVRTAPERLILIFCAAAAFVGALLLSAHVSGFGIPLCVWKCATGLPCAGCGGTRAVALLLQGDAAGALAMNPGAVAVFLSAAALALYASCVLLFRCEPLRIAVPRGRVWRFAAVAFLAANWVYLLLAGRA